MSDAEPATATATAEIVWPITVKLKHPIAFGDDTIVELVFQRGKLAFVKGMKVVREIPFDDLMMIASRLSGQPTQVIDKLDPEDAEGVLAIAAHFYAKCLPGIAL